MEAVPITNTLFPPPPGYYKAFTPEAVVQAAAAEEEGQENDELAALRPPRTDWVLEDGRWMLFGQMYTTEPHIPTAAEIGLTGPVAEAAEQGREGLPILLHSFLHTLLAFVDALTTTARTPIELQVAGRPSEGDQYIQHLGNLAASMMVSANQLRGVQAEATLVMVMERQVEERRRQTEALRAKSREVALTIKRLKGMAQSAQKGQTQTLLDDRKEPGGDEDRPQLIAGPRSHTPAEQRLSPESDTMVVESEPPIESDPTIKPEQPGESEQAVEPGLPEELPPAAESEIPEERAAPPDSTALEATEAAVEDLAEGAVGVSPDEGISSEVATGQEDAGEAASHADIEMA